MVPKAGKKQLPSVLSPNANKSNLAAESSPASAKHAVQDGKIPDDRTAEGKENNSDSPTGTKRKAQDDAFQEQVGSDAVSNEKDIDANCNQVRTKISRFLEAGEMTISEFCKTIDVSDKILFDFLRFSKPREGSDSEAYRQAWKFFKDREAAGVKMPTKKQKTTGAGGSKEKSDGRVDLSGIELDHEAQDEVRVYESCDEVRKKITNYLRRTAVTQASFCRDLVTQLHASKARPSIQGRQLSAFRQKKGPDSGNTSTVFYASYVFFEKLRIKEGKPKSDHRQQMEKIWPGGFNITDNMSGRYTCFANEIPVQDEFGQVTFEKRGPGPRRPW